MKSLGTILLLSSFLAQTFNQAITVSGFYVNQSAIATNCENKFRPALHCNGKCQLAKKLKQEEKKDQRNPERKLENKTEVVSFRSYFVSNISPAEISQHNYFIFSGGNTVDFSFPIFHPPCAC